MKTPDPLAALAKHIADKAIEEDTPFAEVLDAFGKLISYHALKLKHRGRQDDEDEDAPTMDRFADMMHEVETPNGGSGKRVQARAAGRNRTDA